MASLEQPLLTPIKIADASPNTPSTAYPSDSEDALERGQAEDSPMSTVRCLTFSSESETNWSQSWLAFLLYGSAMLLPYNAMLCSVDYFASRFGEDFQFLNAIFLTTPNFLTMFITAFVWKPDNRRGAFWGYAGLCVTCLLVPFMESRNSVLIAAAVIGFFNSLAQAAISGLGAARQELLPALQTGVGLAGVLASGTRIVTKAALGLQTGTYLYFALGAMMSVVALVLLRQHPEEPPSAVTSLKAGCGVVKSLRLLPAVFFLNFLVTLSFFPGLLATLAPHDFGRTLTDGWWPLLLVAGFNVFDFAGRYFANASIAQFSVNGGATKLFLLQFVRMALVYVMAYVATADLEVIALMAALAFTNGWFGSAGFGIQHKILEPELLDQAAVISTFFILFGITSGSFVGQAVFD